MCAKGQAVHDASNPTIHEHDTVNEYLTEVEALLVQHDHVINQLCGAIKGLSEFLLQHMDGEEQSELFRVQPESAAWLQECVHRLRDGHQSLRGQIAALGDTTNVHASHLDCVEFRTRFHALAKELRDHEEAELAVSQKVKEQSENTKS